LRLTAATTKRELTIFVYRGFRFAKRHFYFSEEAVESKQLSVFHQNEKPAVANPTAAWATQTGKGLLFFTKRAEDKATPAGIFNLVSTHAT
jgi:hypothetical protein